MPTNTLAESTIPYSTRRGQRGGTLLVVLLLLMGITLISVSSVNTSVMELRMARNVESSASNFQTALAAIDFVIADPANLPLVGPLNEPVPVTLSGSPRFRAARSPLTQAIRSIHRPHAWPSVLRRRECAMRRA